MGYLQPRITINRNHGLQIAIAKGPSLPITSLNIQISGEGRNNPVIQKAYLTLPLHVGDRFNSTHYEDAKQALLTAAEHEGYAQAAYDKALIKINRYNNTADITLSFNTGVQFYFGQVRFSPGHISPSLLKRYIPFQPSEPYSTEKMLALNSNLAGSGYFGNVTVNPQPPQERIIPIDVTLKDVQRTTYSVGAGYGTDTGVRGQLGLRVMPVNSAGHQFNLNTLGSMTQNTLQAQYIIPGTNPLMDQYTFSGNVSNFNYSAGYSNSVLFSEGLRHDTGAFKRVLSLNELYERFHYNENFTNNETLAVYPKLTLAWNNTHRELFSPSGYRLTLNGLATHKSFLSQVSLAQVSADLRAALMIEPIRTRLYVHLMQGGTQIPDINKLPLSLAQLLGGADNLKGYSFNSIGPGKLVSFAGVEIQKETFHNWYLTGFFDSGDVYKPDAKNLKYDIGGGIMWVSPIGPIKIGVAQAIDNHFHRIADTSPRLVINMGPDL